MKMSSIIGFAGSMLLASHAMAYQIEGYYQITERQDCSGDRSDSIVIYVDAAGEARAAFTSSKFGIVYESHKIAWDGETTLSGSTDGLRTDAGTFTASLSPDLFQIEGVVNSATCEQQWTFKAERAPAKTTVAMQPIPNVQLPEALLGSYAVNTENLTGRLKLLRLSDGRLIANFGNDLVPRIVAFDTVRIDEETGMMELFAHDGTEVNLKWRLKLGILDGRLSLAGYALSTMGKYYSVFAQHN